MGIITIRLIGSNSANDRNIFCIPRINFSFQPTRCPWTVNRRQFPLRLAYATTFNSCQGLTLDRVVLDLRSDVFAHGQLYTAVSRVRNRSCIRRLMREDMVEDSLCRRGWHLVLHLVSRRVMTYDHGRPCLTTSASVWKPSNFTNPRDNTAIELMGCQNKRPLQLKGVRSPKKQQNEERASLLTALDVAKEGDLAILYIDLGHKASLTFLFWTLCNIFSVFWGGHS